MVNVTKMMIQHYQFDDIHVDKYGNIVSGIVDNQPGKTLVLDGHTDTMPMDEEGWSRNPYGGDVEDGKIYGRGTTDMKGAVATMISAAGFFGQDNQRNLARKTYVACIVHEECFEGIAVRLTSEHYKPDYAIIGEASELDLKVGQRGRAEIVVETSGKPAYSTNPQVRINAVYKAARLIDKIRTITSPTHPVLGPGIPKLTDIKSSPYPGASVIPDYCCVIYDRRLLVGEIKESTIASLGNVLAEFTAQDPQFKVRVSYAMGQRSCYTGATIEGERFSPGWVYDESDEFVQAALVGIREAGFNPITTQYSFCTNSSHYVGEAGIKTIGFGPSRENLAHTIDEYIEIGQLTGSASSHYSIIRTLYRQ